MHELASLVREFPFGTFVIILAALFAVERMVTAFVNRNKPECDCDCCNLDSGEEDEEDEDEA